MPPFQKAVSELLQLIGPTLIAFGARSQDRDIASKWISGECHPTQDDETRIYFMLRILNDVSEAESEDVARAWFIGANCDSMTKTPVEMVREGGLREVEHSAMRLLSDSFH